jgi:hypothetical protein
MAPLIAAARSAWSSSHIEAPRGTLPMKTSRTMIAFAFLLMTAAAFADSQGKVQPDPQKACPGFKPHELCFETPKDGLARVEYLSEPFYAVILKTTDRCMASEEERLWAQTLFPRSKVFSMRFQCDDNIEENITYTNVDSNFGFLAVYAGSTLEAARKRLAEVNATGRFPGANIRKMQAKLMYT